MIFLLFSASPQNVRRTPSHVPRICKSHRWRGNKWKDADQFLAWPQFFLVWGTSIFFGQTKIFWQDFNLLDWSHVFALPCLSKELPDLDAAARDFYKEVHALSIDTKSSSSSHRYHLQIVIILVIIILANLFKIILANLFKIILANLFNARCAPSPWTPGAAWPTSSKTSVPVVKVFPVWSHTRRER